MKPRHLLQYFLLPITSIALTAQTGVVVGLGDNRYGQLGTAIPTHVQTLTQIGTGISKIQAAGYLTFLLRNDGSVLGSGQNNYDQILDTGDDDWRYAEGVEAWTDITDISASSSSVLVKKTDGRLLGRGYNFSGQLKFGESQIISSQVLVSPNVTQFSSGGNFSIWLTTSGDLYGTGSNFSGNLGTGSSGTGSNPTTPVIIASNVIKAHAGNSTTLFLRADGSLWGTGNNQSGQLGLGHVDSVNTPVKIADNVIDMVGTSGKSLFITSDNILWGMGANNHGELGPDAEASQLTPVKIAENAVRVAASATFILFIDQQGNAWGLGQNESGQLGVGDTVDRTEPVLITQNAAQVGTGIRHSVILKTNGTAWGAGNTYAGPLFSDPVTFTATPQRSIAGVRKVVAGGNSSFVIQSDQTLRGAGNNNYDVLGTGGVTRPGFNPVAQNVAQISTSGEHSVFVKTDESLWIAGRKWNGESGLIPQPHPNQWIAEMFPRVKNAATGNESTLFVDELNRLWATGKNPHGQLGIGPSEQTYVPILVASNVSAVSSTASHSLFIHQDGGLWGMGLNGGGALGTGTGTETRTPVFITHHVAAAVANSSNSYFLTKDGNLMGLGHNDSGQMGPTAPLFNNNTPQLIAQNVTAFASGDFHTLWVDTDGNLWGSGRADSGQLGAPIISHVSTPRLLAERVLSVAAGESHTLYTQVPETFLTNLSTRVNLKAENPGDLVAGFVIGGTEPMEVLIRAVGPSLAEFGVTNPLEKPSFRIFNSSAEVVGGNDNWGSGSPTEISAVAQELGAFALTDSSADAAALITLPPGPYTIQVERPENTGGTVLLEVYKRNATQWRSRLVNLSVRNTTGSGEDTMIAGFVAAGPQNAAVLVRAVGPTLADYGVVNTMADPELRIFTGNTLITENNDWGGETQIATTTHEVGGFELPSASRDSATIARLSPGAYTAQVSGTETHDIGQALVEVYAVDE